MMYSVRLLKKCLFLKMISVVIPTYKNHELLIANLTRNLPYLVGCEVIIVNDDPTLSIKSHLSEFADQIILIENSKNLGFGGTVNRGITRAKRPYILLLNSDVILKDKSFSRAIAHFQKNNTLFAVGFAQTDGKKLFGKNRIYWERGILNHEKAHNTKHGITAWAEGGACVIDKSKFLELGGFDRLFTPFYWEDIDISYRAWKGGYSVVFDESIVVQHIHETTIGRYFSKNKIKRIALRNQFIFIWKNVTDRVLMRNHLLNIPKLLLGFIIHVDVDSLVGFTRAVLKLPKILRSKKQQREKYIKTDKEIFDLFI